MERTREPVQILAEIAEVILHAKRIIITRHKHPDGDAYGASYGLLETIKEIYPTKEIVCINEDQGKLQGYFKETETDQQEDNFYKEATLFVLDTANTSRISNPKWRLAKTVIKIDHHPEVEEFGDIRWVDDKAAACCELIVALAKYMRDAEVIHRDAAEALYFGLVTDTGRFRYPSTTATTLEAAATCRKTFTNPERMFNFLYLETQRYWAFKEFVFQTSTVYGLRENMEKANCVVIPHWHLEQFDITEEEAGNVVYDLGLIETSPVYAVFVATGDGKYRARLRCRVGKINDIAEEFGGGGHEQAAGCVLQDYDAVIAIISELHKRNAEIVKEIGLQGN